MPCTAPVRSGTLTLRVPVQAVVFVLSIMGVVSADPWADAVVSYVPGANPEAAFTSDAAVALGPPQRVTGELLGFPGSITMFASAFGTDEIISIGEGGELVVRFDEPIIDDPAHPFGADLLIFGNTFFTTSDFEVGNITGDNREPATVEVSADNVNWFEVSMSADALFPTQGFIDAPIFGTDDNFEPAGSIPTDFLKPVNPAFTIDDFLGLTYAEALALYDGSGGGTGIDIGPTGLASVSYVRLSVPAGAGHSAEIDALAAVPEPASATLCAVGALLLVRKRRMT